MKTSQLGSRTVYALDYHPRRGPQRCGRYTVRATEDGHLSVYGCCGQ